MSQPEPWGPAMLRWTDVLGLDIIFSDKAILFFFYGERLRCRAGGKGTIGCISTLKKSERR